MSSRFSQALVGLDWLSTAIVLLDRDLHILHVNPAAENFFSMGLHSCHKHPLTILTGEISALQNAINSAKQNHWSYTAHNIELKRNGLAALHLDVTVTPIEDDHAYLLLEIQPLDRQLQAANEERTVLQQEESRELIRNLAHEIKNPLGGIRGSAQLLERKLPNLALREYTQVIISETDRLAGLMQRLLSSHRGLKLEIVSIHQILERVCSLILGEFPEIALRRDYDISLPDLFADREQLLQTLLNITRNAAQALDGHGEICLATRAQRQATFARKRWPLALEIKIIDNGPGISEDLLERIFFPLVTGRPEGTGLGLAIALDVVSQHNGTIKVESRTGYTSFCVLLPITPPLHLEPKTDSDTEQHKTGTEH